MNDEEVADTSKFGMGPVEDEAVSSVPKPVNRQFNANLRMPQEGDDLVPLGPGKLIAIRSLDPQSFEIVEEQPNLVVEKTPEEIEAIVKGAVRFYNPHPAQKLQPEDIANRLLAEQEATMQAEAHQQALADIKAAKTK